MSEWPDPTWTCAECKREFEWWPDHGEAPRAFKTKRIGGVNRVVGEICRACYEAPPPPRADAGKMENDDGR